MRQNLSNLEKKLGYEFNDKELLKQALTPQSTNQDHNYERLEFLGDRVLGLVLTDLLQTFLPDAKVGKLNDEYIKHARNDAKLSALGEEFKLYEFTGKRGVKNLADAMEALIGAVFIDSKRDYSLAKAFIAKHWAIELGLPTREILPFYVIYKYDDEQLIEGLLKLGLDANSVLRLEGENKQLYVRIQAEYFKACMREAIRGTFDVALGDIYDFDNDTPPVLSEMYNVFGIQGNQASQRGEEYVLAARLKVGIKELGPLINKSLVQIACAYRRIDILNVLVRYGASIDSKSISSALTYLKENIKGFLESEDHNYDDQVREEIEEKYSSAKVSATRNLDVRAKNYWSLYEEQTKSVDSKIEKEVAEEIVRLKIRDLKECEEQALFILKILKFEKIEVAPNAIINFLYYLDEIEDEEKLHIHGDLIQALLVVRVVLEDIVVQSKTLEVSKTSSNTNLQSTQPKPQIQPKAESSKKVNQNNWYSSDDITSYVNLIIEHQLGGYQSIPSPTGSIKGKFLLALKGKEEEFMVVSSAVDSAEILPIDLFLDSKKQERNNLAEALESLFPQLEGLNTLDNEMLLVALKKLLPNKDDNFILIVVRELQGNNYNLEGLRKRVEDLDRQDNRKDIFDELLTKLVDNGNSSSARILFPYNITNLHWLIGEIVIYKTANNYRVLIFTHDPYGGGIMVQSNFEVLKGTIIRRINEEHARMNLPQPVVEYMNEPSNYRRRQKEGDAVSCGVIVAEDMIKLIKGETLDIESPYEVGAISLRERHIAKFEEYLLPIDGRRQSFIQRNQGKSSESLAMNKGYMSQVMSLVSGIKNFDLKQDLTDVFSNRQNLSMYDGSLGVAIKTALEQLPVLLRSKGVQLVEEDINAINSIHRLLFAKRVGQSEELQLGSRANLWVLNGAKAGGFNHNLFL